ncbi:hypothetical protein PPRY_b0797 [Pseudoalteromonas prydzensis ACAM 620]|nr:hypothetical protein [Pseudoalteromonas prydzensis ACAM 620]
MALTHIAQPAASKCAVLLGLAAHLMNNFNEAIDRKRQGDLSHYFPLALETYYKW